jgi:hypothetical protein
MEKLVLALVLIMLVAGFILFYTNRTLFERYTVEDGLIEWLTVSGLLLGSIVCLYRFIKWFKKKAWIFLAITLLLGLMQFVVAGEEISWGQRIMGIKPSEFFEKNNLQHETNFHNLIVNGVKINKVVFTFGLIAMLGIYLLILPLLYRRNEKIKRLVDYCGIPVPRNYQIVSFLLLFAITALLKHEKNAELLECGTGFLFFLIVRYPANEHIFNRAGETDKTESYSTTTV